MAERHFNASPLLPLDQLKPEQKIPINYPSKYRRNKVGYFTWNPSSKFCLGRVCPGCGIQLSHMMVRIFHDRVGGFGKPRAAYYGMRDGKPVMFTVDHIVPLARGGRNDQANKQLMCAECNEFKGCSASMDPRLWILYRVADLENRLNELMDKNSVASLPVKIGELKVWFEAMVREPAIKLFKLEVPDVFEDLHVALKKKMLSRSIDNIKDGNPNESRLPSECSSAG